jgi:predicted nucleotidyltransferase
MNQEMYNRLKKISERLKKEYRAEKVILYGSYARGEEGEDSDIDLFIIAPTQERFFERMATVKSIVHDLRWRLPFSPIVLTQAELKERKKIGDQFIEDILQHGVEL